MAGTRGGFSNDDIKVMFQTNAESVAKSFTDLSTFLVKLNTSLSKVSKESKAFNETNKTLVSTLNSLNSNLTKTVKNTKDFATQQSRASKSTRDTIKNTRDWIVILGQARSALLNVKVVTLDVFTSVGRITSNFEKLKIMMSGLSLESDSVGRMAEAAENFEYVTSLARQAPFSVDALTNAFVKFKTVGIDPTNGSLNALADAVASFGGTELEMSRAAVAIQQMGGKGVVSMEELRQQLGEAVPSALKMMARGANMSIKDFVKAVSLGQVEASSAIEAMNQEFAKAYAGSAQNLMNTYDGLIARMKTEWQLLVSNAAETSGLYKTMKDYMVEFIDYLNSPEAEHSALKIAEALKLSLDALMTMVKFVNEHKSIISMTIISIGLMNVTKLVTGFASAAVVGMNKALKPMLKVVSKVNGIDKAFVALSFTLKSISKLLISGFGLSALIGTVGALTIKIKSMRDSLVEVSEEISKQGGKDITEKSFSLEKLNAAKEALDTMALAYVASSNADKEWSRNAEQNWDKIFGKLIEWIVIGEDKSTDFYKSEIDKFSSFVTQLTQAQDKIKARADQRGIIRTILEGQSEGNSAYQNAMNDIEKKVENEDSYTWEKRNKDLEKANEDRVASFIKVSEDLKKGMELALSNAKEGTEKAISEEYLKEIENIEKTIAQVTKNVEIQLFKGKAVIEEWKEAYMKALVEQNSLIIEQNNSPYYSNAVKKQEATQAAGKTFFEVSKTTKNMDKSQEQNFWKEGAIELARLNAERRESVRLSAQQAKDSEKNISKLKDYYASVQEGLNISKENYENEVEGIASVTAVKKRLASLTDELAEAQKKQYAQSNLETIKAAELTHTYNTLNKIKRGTADLEAQIADENAQNIDEELALMKKRFIEEVNFNNLNKQQSAEAMRNIDARIAKERELYEIQNKSPFAEMMDEWADTSNNFSQVWADTMSSMKDELVSFVKTGEFNFDSLIDSMLEGMLEVALQASISSMFGGGSSGGGGGFMDMAFKAGMAYFGAPTMHTGGIVGGNTATTVVSPSVFANATKYHSGGVAGLKPNEVPTILERGEGVFTQDQMKAMGGGSQASVTVNVINQTQEDVSAEQGQPKFDGQSMILDVVLKAANQPGSFRDGLRGAVK